MIRFLSFLLPLALVAPAVGLGADLAAAARFVDAVNADWIPAMRARDAERVARPYAEDAVFVTRANHVIVGRSAIAGLFRKSFTGGSRVVSGAIHRRALEEANGFLIEWGDAELTVLTAAGKEVRSSSTYLTVWRPKADGSWEIVRNLNL